jgi:glycosyltransferase involved in cell wall biosynthesis
MKATAGALAASAGPKPRLVYVVTEDWSFVTHFLPMARAARDAGFEVVVVTRVQEHRAAIEEEGFRLVNLGADRSTFDPLKLLRTIFSLRKILKTEKPDLIHALALKSVVLGGIAAGVSKSPAKILSVTGLGYLWTSDGPKQRVARALVRGLVGRLARNGNTRFTLENPDDLSDLGLGEGASVIGGWGIDADALKPSATPRQPPLRVAFLGRMLRSKGIADTVEAVRRARAMGVDVELDLWGLPDHGNLTSHTTQELEKFAATAGVTWRGRAPDVRAVWSGADIAILLTQREGLPRSLIEAAASGLPMIATDVPGCRSIVRDGVDGFLVPRCDPDAAAKAIARLARDQFLRARMGAAARLGFEARFTTDAVVPRIVDLYLELTRRPGFPPTPIPVS